MVIVSYNETSILKRFAFQSWFSFYTAEMKTAGLKNKTDCKSNRNDGHVN